MRAISDRDPGDETAASFPSEEEIEVFDWRFSVALEMGFDPELALDLADSRTDLHDVAALVARGCDRVTAARIVWRDAGD